MRPAQINLTIYQYTDFSQSFTWKSGTPPVAVSLAGGAARFMARVNHSDVVPLLSLTTTPNAQGVLLIEPDDNSGNPQTGMISVMINKATTATLLSSVTPFWQLFVDLPAGTTVPLVTGRIVVIPEDVH
jgi:hypothetical protein